MASSVWDLRLGQPEGWLGTAIIVEAELGRQSGGPILASPSFHGQSGLLAVAMLAMLNTSCRKRRTLGIQGPHLLTQTLNPFPCAQKSLVPTKTILHSIILS